ncbi:MAG: ribose 5-phosphate isomerase B [Candidatus Nanopelagicales bacterium]|nr:ribose 5-phosphate isomerase B [Candidatus Nanopelagicales bacterium]MCF8539640.1 ribose 5-phosphate isomerase B [Candidatus Nanopelagicales bacterium]
MIIAVGSDHAGFALKSVLSAWLLETGHQVHDVGTFSPERVDYPEYGAELGRVVTSGEAELGIGVCGSGQGICMAANKVHGVRGAVIRTEEDAQLARAHNDANIACLGERATDPELAKQLIQVFLDTPFDGGRHAARVEQLNELM